MEMLYLTTLNTFYLRLYGVTHICKGPFKGNLLPPLGYSFRLEARVLLYASSHIHHTTVFVTPVVEHWLERDIAQWVHYEGSLRLDGCIQILCLSTLVSNSLCSLYPSINLAWPSSTQKPKLPFPESRRHTILVTSGCMKEQTTRVNSEHFIY